MYAQLDGNPTAQKLLDSFHRLKKVTLENQKKNLKLRPSEFHLLKSIKTDSSSEQACLKVSELSRHLDVTSPTVTQMVNSLEERDYVIRRPDENDKRSVLVFLTEKGENILAESFEFFIKHFTGLVAFLGEEKSLKLSELLNDVFKYYEKGEETC